MAVVYFDQPTGASHAVHWSKYYFFVVFKEFLIFFLNKKKKDAKK